MAAWTGSLREEGGVTMLAPYCMPRSVNKYGENEDQGRFCIAYSRDGWFILDTDEGSILRWCCTEQEAIRARFAILNSTDES